MSTPDTTYATQAAINEKQYRERVAQYHERVAQLPRKPVVLRCPSGHEWATTYADATASTYPHYDQDHCPVCDEMYVSGRNAEEAE